MDKYYFYIEQNYLLTDLGNNQVLKRTKKNYSLWNLRYFDMFFIYDLNLMLKAFLIHKIFTVFYTWKYILVSQ